jgi:hypothetical protein
MTYQDFQKKIHKNSFLKYWSYCISIFVMTIGLYFIYLLHFTDWYEIRKPTTPNIAPTWAINIMGGLFTMAGLYGFWRIPITYKITCIESKHSLTEKNEIINQILNDFKLTELEKDEQYRHVKYPYPVSLWNRFDVYLFFDRNTFYLNTQTTSYGGGFIDFGASKSVTNIMRSKIIASL